VGDQTNEQALSNEITKSNSKKVKISKRFGKVKIFVGSICIVTLFFMVWLFKDGLINLNSSPYQLPPQSQKTWNDLFAAPAQITMVKPLKTGEIAGNWHNFINTENPNFKYLTRKKPDEIMAFWIRHEKFGDILIDSGFDSSFYKNPPYGNFSPMMRVAQVFLGFQKSSQKEGQDIVSQLRKHGIKPQIVFLTNLHADHTSGLPMLPNDIECIFDERELNFISKTLAGGHFKNKEKIKTVSFVSAITMPPLGPVLDVLGDGSLWAISTPGHSEGHMSYLAFSTSGPILITGDVVFFFSAFEHGVESVGIYSQELAFESLQMLKKFVEMFPKTKVFVGHEYQNDTL